MSFVKVTQHTKKLFDIEKLLYREYSTKGNPKDELVFKEQELFMPHYCADDS